MSEHDRSVSALPRTLKFFPVRNPLPRRLSMEEISSFNSRGYISGCPVFGRGEAELHRADFDAILSDFLASGMDSYSIDRYQDRIAAIHDLATHPAILDAVEDIVGPDIVCWATHYFCKLPGDDQMVAWHQDASYWALTPSKTVTVWLAIDDADEENGCMRVLPGSHLHGHLPWRETTGSDRNVLTQSIDDVGRLGEPVSIPLRAGEISLHSDLLVHGSLPNRSTRRRCGLTLRYCPPDVRAYWGWNEKSIICRGSDPSGHWANVPRPESNVLFPSGVPGAG